MLDRSCRSGTGVARRSSATASSPPARRARPRTPATPGSSASPTADRRGLGRLSRQAQADADRVPGGPVAGGTFPAIIWHDFMVGGEQDPRRPQRARAGQEGAAAGDTTTTHDPGPDAAAGALEPVRRRPRAAPRRRDPTATPRGRPGAEPAADAADAVRRPPSTPPRHPERRHGRDGTGGGAARRPAPRRRPAPGPRARHVRLPRSQKRHGQLGRLA